MEQITLLPVMDKEMKKRLQQEAVSIFLIAYILIGKLLGITSPIPWISLLN
ncbi:hypothetical protein ACTFSP_29315 [Bacillus cereus group sp. MYBK108-2]|uniref:hypothetical protein n=1 Tax=Bacillus cereus group TaxID=86661 RepID=UPI000B16D06C|nr:hypothetical protein [Bacillus cereus]